ncbi:A disintegrin and metalloproteinase with thrombospondin motifs adt-1 [Hydra vulgaris]|uniref:A disintegrin and metalloproteinase with thrombospondin motifs adt-1 n=1 Tax=Hydra vulgaris TaxID=6087 RepID=UPI001F5F5734|nr:A disintegrin and metalloproteinase with thrombospondin motifs adt-1 [Hydra vulgaris]
MKIVIVIIYLTLLTSKTCQQNTIAVFCDFSSSSIICPDRSIILIQSALYGRNNSKVCPNKLTVDLSKCKLKNITDVVRNICNGKNSCSILSKNVVVNPDPCINVTKYTIVNYNCYLENSFFIEKIENEYTRKSLDVFYDEFVVSFVILSTGKPTTSIIDITDKNVGSVLSFNIFGCCYLNIISLSNVFSIEAAAKKSTSVLISNLYINNDNTYKITMVVNGTVQFSNITTQPMVFNDVVLYTFVDCSFNSFCNYGSIKNLSIYSKTQVVWSEWSEWSLCNTSCISTRTRNCSSNRMLNCSGSSVKTRSCTCLYKEFFLIQNETSILKNNLVKTLMKHTKEYTVSFEIKPTRFLYEWANVIHLTTNNNNHKYGDRNPAVFFHQNGSGLHICSAVSGIINYVKNTNKLGLHNWSSVKIAQEFKESKYIYSIELNGQRILYIENNDTRDFSNVKVYVSNPWYEAQPGFIKNLKITQGNRKWKVSWTQWSDWSSCNVSNGIGFKKRTRMCHDSFHLCCNDNYEVKECFAFWTPWSSWSICNTYGLMNRSRSCNISNSGDFCAGNTFDVKECYAYWSKWSDWTACNASYGFINRTRECKISNASDWCYNNNTEVLECFAIWAQRSNLTNCNFSHGFLDKSRVCEISNVIDWCHGSNFEVMECFEKWTTWSECSITCGVGSRSRYSQHGTKKVTDEESCNQINCPEDGMWGTWKKSECSNTCGKGIKFVSRSCDKPSPSFNGRDCIGVSNYTEVCDNDIVCPLNGNWSMWSSWSLCSQPCGGGFYSRFRNCSNPIPKFGGQGCNGNIKEFVNCTKHYCKSTKLNLRVNFIDEMYNDWYSQLTSTRSLLLINKIQDEITKLYTNHKVNFIIVVHSIENDP